MMLKHVVTAVLVLGLAACADQPLPTATEIALPLFAKGGNSGFNMGTHLTGDEEVFTPIPPLTAHPADSRAQGQAIFRVSRDGTSIDFRLIASNIDNVHMAHIHCGRFGENGPIAIWLFPTIGTSGPIGGPPTRLGPQNGVLASGTFSPVGVQCAAANVGTDMPLLDAMRAGLTYVNVHTTDGVAPANTGPGDFPGGEIRGQIEHASH